MPADKIYIDSKGYEAFVKYDKNDAVEYDTILKFTAVYHRYNYMYGGVEKTITFEKVFGSNSFTDEMPILNTYHMYDTQDGIIISDELLCEMAESVLNDSYKQASLFFENDKAAHDAAEKLQDAGYIAVPSDTTYDPDAATVIMSIVSCVMLAFVWILAIVFLAFFINLCSSRTLGAFKGDMAIMRSMGIPVKVIRIGMYVRMLISLIPAFILVILTAILIFTTPKFNEYFVYLYAWQYATYKQIRKLFGESVKKSLKGGNAE